jgi:hypothetical protein
MDDVERLSEDLMRLEQVLKRSLFGSREFKNLRKKIKDMGLEINVLLMVMARDGQTKKVQIKKKRWDFKLSSKDQEFLKGYGIKW